MRLLALALCAGGVVTPALAQMKPILGDQRGEIIHAPVVACFAEGTDPIYARRVELMVNQMNAVRFGGLDYQLTGRWSGAQGSPRALTWSFVPDGLSISSGTGEPVAPSNLFAQMDAKFAGVGGRATWIAQYTAVFARWQQLSGLTYTRITVGGNDWDDGAAWGTGGAAGARGDLRFSGKAIDGGSGVLAYNFFPSNGDMVVDTAENWQSGSPSFLFLRNTLAHEHGHGMGLLHVCPIANSKLMEPFLSTSFNGPQQDDIRGAQRHYGDPYEANDSSGAAKPMGALSIPGNLTFGTIPTPAVSNAALLSIDADGETDFWSFTVAAPCTVSASATPVGSTYLSGTQTGQCNTGTQVNALAMADLSIALLASNGTTVIASSSSAAAGVAETVANISITTPGTYYIRVTETNSPAESQLYQISLNATNPPVCPQITSQPSPVTECLGAQTGLSVTATGSPAPTYQWRRNTVNIPGATNATYFIGSLALSHAGSYDCVVTNPCNSVISDAVPVVVEQAPAYSTHPASQSIPPGSPVTFTVALDPTSNLLLSWRKDSVAIPGANSTSYSIASVSLGDAGVYDCVATNLCGETISNPATLTVSGTLCYPNCDGSSGNPLLTANDFTCFINAFAAGESYANCDGSTGTPLLTANDFTCFVNAYAFGCS